MRTIAHNKEELKDDILKVLKAITFKTKQLGCWLWNFITLQDFIIKTINKIYEKNLHGNLIDIRLREAIGLLDMISELFISILEVASDKDKQEVIVKYDWVSAFKFFLRIEKQTSQKDINNIMILRISMVKT